MCLLFKKSFAFNELVTASLAFFTFLIFCTFEPPTSLAGHHFMLGKMSSDEIANAILAKIPLYAFCVLVLNPIYGQ